MFTIWYYVAYEKKIVERDRPFHPWENKPVIEHGSSRLYLYTARTVAWDNKPVFLQGRVSRGNQEKEVI
jgi:hypothetical protein